MVEPPPASTRIVFLSVSMTNALTVMRGSGGPKASWSSPFNSSSRGAAQERHRHVEEAVVDNRDKRVADPAAIDPGRLFLLNLGHQVLPSGATSAARADVALLRCLCGRVCLNDAGNGMSFGPAISR